MTRWVIPVAKRLLIEEACKNAPTQPLEEVAHIEMGQSPDGDSCNDDGDGIPLIGGPADLGLEFPQSTRWTNSPTKLCKPGDIIVCVRATIGEPRWADGIYCLGRGVAGIRPVDKYLLPKFLFFIIEGNEQILQNQGTGTTFKTISKQHLASIQVPMIPVEEQEIIVSFLLWLEQNSNSRPNFLLEAPSLPASLTNQLGIIARIEELAAKIEEARGLRREAEEEAEALFPSALESLFEGNDATCWRYEKLAGNGLATVVAGQHIMAEEYNLSGDGIPYLTGPADFGARVAEIKRWTLTPKSTALPGDILLTVKGAGVGKINLAPSVEVAIGRQLMAIRPNPSRLLHEFVYFFLEHKFEHFRSIATATTVPGFKKTNVEELRIPILDLAEQRYIVSYLDNLQSKVISLKQLQSETTDELDALLPSILDKAFKGEL